MSSAELLTVGQVAAQLQVSRGTVYNLVRRGELIAVKVTPRKTRFRVEDLEAFQRQHRTRPRLYRKSG